MKTNPSHDSAWKYLIFCSWLTTCIAIVIAGQFNNRASYKTANPNANSSIAANDVSAATSTESVAENSRAKKQVVSNQNDGIRQPMDELIPHADPIPIVNGTDHRLDTVSYNVESPNGRVLIVRGIMTVFSLGLNEIGKELQNQGYDVRVTTVARSVLEAKKMRLRAIRANDGAPVIIIGHSLGADRAPQLAGLFAEKNLSVDLMVLLDSTMPGSPPSNVNRCVNYFQSKSAANIFKGKQIEPVSPRTEIVNVNIQSLLSDETANINHFNIDSNPWIQQLLVGTVKNGTQSTTTTEFKQYIDGFAAKHLNQYNEPQNEVKSAHDQEWQNLSDETYRK